MEKINEVGFGCALICTSRKLRVRMLVRHCVSCVERRYVNNMQGRAWIT